MDLHANPTLARGARPSHLDGLAANAERHRRLPIVEVGSVRIVVGASVAQLRSLQVVLAGENAARRYSTCIVDLWCAGGLIHLAAVNGGEVVGAAATCHFSQGFCELHKLYVAPASQRRDVATRLVREVERVAREREWLEIGIETSGDSETFWVEYLDRRAAEVQSEGKVILRVGT